MKNKKSTLQTELEYYLSHYLSQLKAEYKENEKVMKIDARNGDYGTASHLQSVNCALEHVIASLETCIKTSKQIDEKLVESVKNNS